MTTLELTLDRSSRTQQRNGVGHESQRSLCRPPPSVLSSFIFFTGAGPTPGQQVPKYRRHYHRQQSRHRSFPDVAITAELVADVAQLVINAVVETRRVW
jgi:hypothetical protein